MAKPRNYRGVSLPDELVERVEQLIEKLGTYRTIAEFVSEAVRLRLEALEKRRKKEEAS
jgi:Arc/MetJ-type ribon-helix-helix transcriptional regulator